MNVSKGMLRLFIYSIATYFVPQLLIEWLAGKCIHSTGIHVVIQQDYWRLHDKLSKIMQLYIKKAIYQS